jgi:integrase
MRGSVRKDETRGTWTVVVDNGTDPLTGKRRQLRRRGFTSERAAHRALGQMLRDAQTGEYVEPTGQNVSQYVTEWLDTIRPAKDRAGNLTGNIKPATFAQYETLLTAYVIPRVGGVPLRALDAGRLSKLYRTLLESGRRDGTALSARTVEATHKVVRRALGDAVRWGRLTKNPAEHAEVPRPGHREMRTWDAEQVRAFLDSVAEHRLRAAYHLAFMTGLRRGELLGVQWADINFDRAQLAVRRNRVAVGYDVSEGSPKTGRARTIALDPATVTELRAHRKRQLEERLAWGDAWTETGFVFVLESGEPIHPQRFTYWFDRAVAATDLPRIRLHDVRHTHATLGLAAGVPAKVMAERLGHANVSITLDLYSHVTETLQVDAAARVAATVFGTPTAEVL